MRFAWLLCLVAGAALADGETLYLRPVAECANDGDGTAYACAASGGAAGAWNTTTGFNDTTKLALTDTVGKIDPGDTLCISGTIIGQITFGEAESAGDLGSGTSGSRITIDGLCNSVQGTLDPTSANYAFYTEQSYIDVTDLNADGPTLLGNLLFFAADADKQNTVTRGSFTNCDVATGESCVHLVGDNFTIDAVRCDGAEQYCVLSNGTGNTIRNSHSYANGGGGSCFVLDGETDGATLQDNVCIKAAAGGACYEVNDQTPAASTAPTLQGNYCKATASGASRGYLIKGTANVYGGYTEDTNTAFEIDTGAGGQPGAVVVSGATSINAATQHVFIGSGWTDVHIYHSTFKTGGDGVDSDDTSSSTEYKNNIFKDLAVALDETTASSNVNEYNVFHGNTQDREVNGVPTAVDGTSITSDPTLDANNRIAAGSTAWDAGTAVTPWYGYKALCFGLIVNIGSTCAQSVIPQHRLSQ